MAPRHEGFHRHLLLPTTHRLDDVPRLPLASLYGEPTGACLGPPYGRMGLGEQFCVESIWESMLLPKTLTYSIGYVMGPFWFSPARV